LKCGVHESSVNTSDTTKTAAHFAPRILATTNAAEASISTVATPSFLYFRTSRFVSRYGASIVHDVALAKEIPQVFNAPATFFVNSASGIAYLPLAM
jgi:hypothetical protein